MTKNRKSVQRGGAAVELGRDQAEVQEILDHLAAAVTAGDGNATAEMWAVPAFVLGEEVARPIATLSEVVQFFSGAKFEYSAKGVMDTRAEIVDLKWPTERIAMVEVRWPWLDEEGNEMGDELSTYVFRRDDSDRLRIQIVIMQGSSPDR